MMPIVTSTTTSHRADFLAGVKDTLPLVVGGIPFGIIFGALAAGAGLSPVGTLAMSALVFAGSAQFIAVGLIAGQVSIPIIVLTTFVVNLRHMLYSASLGPYVKHLPQRWLIPLAFWLTDETYLIVIRRFQTGLEAPRRQWYYLGSAVIMYVDWQLSTLLGVVAGHSIPNPQNWGLDFALIVTFIGMIVPAMKNRSSVVSVIVAGGVALLANGLPNRLGLMLAALAGVLAGMLSRALFGETEPVEVVSANDAVGPTAAR
jgi:4-azaleucine resistance transporter AzlC